MTGAVALCYARPHGQPGAPDVDPRLNAPAVEPGQGHNRPPGRGFTCEECGGPEKAHAPHGKFCSDTCRSRWNNRRLQRGAILYDLYMCARYERRLGAKLKVWTLICRLLADFRAEDWESRDGRRSWRDARKVIEERPHLTGKVFKPRRGK